MVAYRIVPKNLYNYPPPDAQQLVELPRSVPLWYSADE